MGREIASQAEHSKQHINEMMVCQMRALIRELWPDEFGTRPKLEIVGKPVAKRATPAETFHDASLTIVEFARRWREGKASPSEVEDADVLLLGIRRLLADGRTLA